MRRWALTVLGMLACDGPAAPVSAPEFEPPPPPPPGPQRGTLADPAAAYEIANPVGPDGYVLGRIVHRRGPVTWIEITPAHAPPYLRAWGIEFDSFGFPPHDAVVHIDAALPTALRWTFGARGDAIARDLARYRGQYCEYRGLDDRLYVVGCSFAHPNETWDTAPQRPDGDPEALCVDFDIARDRIVRLRLGDRPDWTAVPWPRPAGSEGPQPPPV